MAIERKELESAAEAVGARIRTTSIFHRIAGGIEFAARNKRPRRLMLPETGKRLRGLFLIERPVPEILWPRLLTITQTTGE